MNKYKFKEKGKWRKSVKFNKKDKKTNRIQCPN